MLPGIPMIIIYTDGSCNPAFAIGGWAALLLMGDEKIMLSGYQVETTHQRMELTAALRALEYVMEHRHPSEPVQLYADSQYVVGIDRRKAKLEANDFLTRKQAVIRNDDLVRPLIRCSSILNLQFIKVKAHLRKEERDNDFNRQVDKLSRKIVRDRIEKLSSF